MDDEKGDRWKWGRNVDGFTEEEKKIIMGHVVETMVMATFKNHFYKWDGQVRRQKKGAAMGVRASGSLARVCMDRWIRLFREKLEGYGMIVKLLKKYVDDVLIICVNLKLGSRYQKEQDCIVWSKEWELEDLRNGVSRSKNTMMVLREVADSVMSFLQFTAEVSEGREQPVPCLDTQLWYGYPDAQKEWFNGGLARDQETQGLQW